MTLIVSAFNNQNIIICSDTLTTVDIDNERTFKYTKKIIKINKYSAIGVSGFFTESTMNFIKIFCVENRRVIDIGSIERLLYKNINDKLQFNNSEVLNLIIVGSTDGNPSIKVININPKGVNTIQPRNNFFSIGYDNPSREALKILSENKIITKANTKELEILIRHTVLSLIEEFKYSKNEKLGGGVDLIVLSLNTRRKNIFTRK